MPTDSNPRTRSFTAGFFMLVTANQRMTRRPQLEGVCPFPSLIAEVNEKAGNPSDVGFFGAFRDV